MRLDVEQGFKAVDFDVNISNWIFDGKPGYLIATLQPPPLFIAYVHSCLIAFNVHDPLFDPSAC